MSPHTLRHKISEKLGQLTQSRDSSPHNHPDIISSVKQIEEETLPKYRKDTFYPAKIDEILNDRYQICAKLGYGVTATVWLARDTHASSQKDGRKYVTIKINVNTLSDDWLKGRREIAERLSSANPKHAGYQHVRFMLDTFKVKGPHGHHLCVVYDVLREPIGICMDKFPSHLFSSDHLRILLPALLKGLDYLHSEARVVHTDLKADNIMMGLGDPTILDRFVQDAYHHPSPRKTPDAHGRIIYQSRSDFGDAPTDAVIASAKITDIGLATWGDELHNHSIQSNAFTAPEVILTAGWSYPADIWNLGVMLWDLCENFGLFDAIDTRPGHYKSDKHLGLMIALMGPPPAKLLEMGSTSATYFDDKGEFRHPHYVPTDLSFESSITRLGGEDKELFIDFVKKMICWLPEDRWTASQLLQHPWLKPRGEKGRSVHFPSCNPVDDANVAEATAKIKNVSINTSTGTSITPRRSSPLASGATTPTKPGISRSNTDTSISPSSARSVTLGSSEGSDLIRAILDRKK